MNPARWHGERVYVDTNVLIYSVEADMPMEHCLRDCFTAADRGELTLCVSELVLAEVLVKPLRDGNAALAARYRTLFSRASPLMVGSLDRSTMEAAAQLRANTPTLKLMDALHLASAAAMKCAAFLSADRQLAGVGSVPVVDPTVEMPV